MTAGAGPAGRSNTEVRSSTDRRVEPPNVPPPVSELVPSGINLPVLPEDRAHGVGDLADGRLRLDGADDRGNQVIGPVRGGRDGVERGPPLGRVARSTHLADALDLTRFHVGIDLQGIDRVAPLLAGGLPVDADDDTFPGIDTLLRLVGGVLDPALDETRLDRAQRPAG